LSRTWYHTIEFPDGSVTPGFFDTRESPRFVPWPGSLHGKRCLDVGTFDGFWAFEMERRGGNVVALDLDDPDALDWPFDSKLIGPGRVREWQAERGPGFLESSAAVGSNAERIDQSVYDLDPDRNGTFDVVLCGDLLLHLRDPVRAIEAMRSVCAGCLLLVESIDHSLELLAPRIPAARLELGFDQWWRVNSAGLAGLAKKAGFRVEAVGPRYLVPFGRGAGGLRASRLASIAARDFRKRGVLHRALRAVPREPVDLS
jgi:tRNA (mo5U34)-methyltransferase